MADEHDQTSTSGQTSTIGTQSNNGDRMQRIRVGLTGLAVVLLLVALASAFFSRFGGNVTSPAIAAAEKAKSKDEPLANLGVAPGAPANETAPVTVPPKVIRH